MRPRLIAIFLVLVLTPIGLLAWLGVRLAHDEQQAVRARVQDLLQTGLRDTRSSIVKVLAERERELLRLTDLPALEAEAIRELVRRSGIVRQVFVLGPDCGRIHPPVGGPLTSSERDFIARAKPIWPDVVGLCRGGRPMQASGEDRGDGPAPARASQGWYVWRWGGAGADLVFWRRPAGGGLVGVELNSIRLLADIVGELPHAGPDMPGPVQGRTALVDQGGRVLYQWGDLQPADDEPPAAELALGHPLDSWKLVHHVPDAAVEQAVGSSVTYTIVTFLLLAGLALMGLAVYFFRQQSKLMRQATQRVSFVNRVSHELRTPLTNVRLYAELLQGRLGDADEKTRRQLDVIVSESGRLSRLIANVLAFSRQQKGSLGFHPTPGRVDDVIRLVLEHFGAALDDKGVEVTFEPGAEAEVLVDADALEQILGNLMSNVEKYVPAGGKALIESLRQGDRTIVRVSDNGPGIPAGQLERVFEPFFRASDKLTDGVSGTGLGLGIARDLARLHGGGLRIVPSSSGACLELEIHTPPPVGDGGSS